jgi:spore coat polysaccharide biosynthesis predicted glycosyltransferase SpsG
LGTSHAERPVVAIRVDGDGAVGLGHVRRCLALAAALGPAAEVRFFLCGSEPVAAMIEGAGIRCERVAAPLAATLERLGPVSARALGVDSYSVARSELAVARGSVPVVAVFDDQGGERPPADLVIDPTPGREASLGARGARCLAGPRFAPLLPEFALPVARRIAPRAGRILVVLGGATPIEIMAAAARAVRRADAEAELDLLLGPVVSSGSGLAELTADLTRVRIHRAPATVRPLMVRADLAVTGGGVTVFELAATGTPAIGVELAVNQRPNLHGMAAAGTLVCAGAIAEDGPDGIERAVRVVAVDPERRAAMSRRGRELVDGQGASRIAGALLMTIESGEVSGWRS